MMVWFTGKVHSPYMHVILWITHFYPRINTSCTLSLLSNTARRSCMVWKSRQALDKSLQTLKNTKYLRISLDGLLPYSLFVIIQTWYVGKSDHPTALHPLSWSAVIHMWLRGFPWVGPTAAGSSWLGFLHFLIKSSSVFFYSDSFSSGWWTTTVQVKCESMTQQVIVFCED